MALSSPNVLPLYSQRAVRPPRSRLATFAVYMAFIGLGTLYGLMMAYLPVGMMMIPTIPIVVMFLLSLWMLPDINIWDDPAMHKTFLIFMSLFIVWPSYLAFAIPGIPWISPTRIALFWLMVLFLWAVATSSQLRAEMVTTAKVSKPAFYFLMLFLVAQVISLPFGDDPISALERAINNQFYWTGMFFLACHLFLQPGALRRFLVVLMWLAAITVLIALWENRIEMIPYAPYIPSFLRSDEAYLARILSPQARAADGYYRAHSVFVVGLTFAEFLSLCLPFVIHFAMTTRSTVNRALAAAGYVLFSAGIWISHSRLGVVGWFETHFLYLLIWSTRRMYFRKSDMIAPALTYGFPAMFIGFVGLVMAWQRLRTTIFGTGAAQSSTDARYMQRDKALPIIFKNPLGYGAAQGAEALDYRNAGGVQTVDSYFLTLALDYGILGFISYFGFCISGAIRGLKTYFRSDDDELMLSGPLAIAVLNSVVIKLVLSQEQMQPLLFLFMGALMAAAFRYKMAVEAARTGAEVDKSALVLARG